MSDFSIKGSDPSFESNPVQNPLDEFENTLRMPGDDAERFGRMQEMFQNLAPNDAKDLFDRMQANNDPSAKEFNAIPNADDLKSILQSKFAPEANSELQNQFEQPVKFSTSDGANAKVKQLNIDAAAKQQELNKQLSAGGKARSLDFPADVGNDKLKEINIHRQTNKDNDLTITHYPNGVQVRQKDTYSVQSKDIVTREVNRVSIQKAGERIAHEIDAPPGGSIHEDKDGGFIAVDAAGNEAARMDKDGNVQVHSYHGDYKQSADGSIHFSTKEKVNPGSLKKEGPVSPADYQNYGISTDGKTLRFPNGVEYTPPDPNAPPPGLGERKPRDIMSGLKIPKDIGNAAVDQVGHHRHGDIVTGETIDGMPLVRGDTGQLIVPVEGGEFEVDVKGNVSYTPHKH